MPGGVESLLMNLNSRPGIRGGFLFAQNGMLSFEQDCHAPLNRPQARRWLSGEHDIQFLPGFQDCGAGECYYWSALLHRQGGGDVFALELCGDAGCGAGEGEGVAVGEDEVQLSVRCFPHVCSSRDLVDDESSFVTQSVVVST